MRELEKTEETIATVNVISVVNARTHNLKNISLRIPRDQLVVITGRSGSGKSSLAFDTIYAEGQRQFMESLSLYSRQFIGSLPAADVERIDGLQPTLCLDQNYRNRDRRSTVGTISEAYHYLSLLMARFGKIHCYRCGQPIQQQTAHEIRDALLNLPERTKLIILAPLVRSQTGKHENVLRKIRREGLVRSRIDGTIFDIDETPELNPKQPHTIDAVTDRIIVREGVEDRLLEAIERSVKLSGGSVIVSRLKTNDGDQTEQWFERLFSTRYACADCDIHYAEVSPRTFSFNSPVGACESCQGVGCTFTFDPALVIGDRSRSIADGAIAAWCSLSRAAFRKQLGLLEPVLKKLKLTADVPLEELTDDQWTEFLHSNEKQSPGLIAVLQRELATSLDDDRLDELESMQNRVNCHACGGSRVNDQARAVFVKQRNIGHLVDMPIDDLVPFFHALLKAAGLNELAQPLIRQILRRIEFLQHVGVGYLSLGRSADTLSGGEHQRVRLATSIGSGLTGVCFVLDEPSIGLHSRDNQRLIQAIRSLQGSGNSVLVVEHDRAMIEQADRVFDLGPGAGIHGGQVVAEGTAADIQAANESLTGKYLSGELTIEIPSRRRSVETDKQIKIVSANLNNLENINIQIPTGVFTCVTGVSGSGKSTLINQVLVPEARRATNSSGHHFHESFQVTLPLGGSDALAAGEGRAQESNCVQLPPEIRRIIVVDQRPIGRSTRACPATHTGLLDHFRKLFAATKKAKQLGFGIGRFTFNSRTGWCPECKGHGLQRVDMSFLPDMTVPCDLCNGQRFDHSVLQVRFGELNIADVLNLSIDEALQRFDGFEKIRSILATLESVGLGYLKLGQSTLTLSGGELQRIKLANELAGESNEHTLYVLDEPTTGLHFDDLRQLVSVLQSVVERGHTLVVIEHDLDVIKCADWVIDLGPEGGQGGGQVVATGTPEQVAAVEGSWTGKYLKPILDSATD